MASNLKTITVTDAANATSMPAAAIRRLLEDGAIAGNRVGRKWWISEKSLEAWVNSKHEQPETRAPRVFPEVQDRFS